MSITGDQLRMARAALKLTLRELEVMAEIDKSTIVRIENGGNAYDIVAQAAPQRLGEGWR
jgi:transcriptional regulator with XRE-family HTH domain